MKYTNFKLTPFNGTADIRKDAGRCRLSSQLPLVRKTLQANHIKFYIKNYFIHSESLFITNLQNLVSSHTGDKVNTSPVTPFAYLGQLPFLWSTLH